MKKVISIIGSTGSIGTQTLEIAESLDIRVTALAAANNIDLLEKQIRKFNPKFVSVANKDKAEILRNNIKDLPVKVYTGMEGLIKVATEEEAECVVTAVVGMVGLIPTIEAIKKGKDIALANKETLVTAGEIVTKLSKEKNVNIYPVDSEHSAIFQCLQGNSNKQINKIILTASGGPFFGYTRKELENVTLEQALKHPNWSMGKKITIDSATMMNKGLELIEAVWLFGVKPSEIEIAVHRQSIIHSMVEYNDFSIISQLSSPDMRLPIQYALTYPDRCDCVTNKLDIFKMKKLTFERADEDVFTPIKMCRNAIEIGGTMPCALNGANEALVELFLKNKITFCDIIDTVKKVMELHVVNLSPTIDDIILCDKWARKTAIELCELNL